MGAALAICRGLRCAPTSAQQGISTKQRHSHDQKLAKQSGLRGAQGASALRKHKQASRAPQTMALGQVRNLTTSSVHLQEQASIPVRNLQ